MSKRKKKVLIGSGIAAGAISAAAAVSHSVTKKLASIAMDRPVPKVSEKRLLIVPGAGHGQSYWTEREKYETTMQEFWADFDGQCP